jgi:hypothetical protein
MTDTIQDKEINTEDAILHHKEGIDLIPSKLELKKSMIILSFCHPRLYDTS